MKYLLLIFLFACSHPSKDRKGEMAFGRDSTGIVPGPVTISPLPPDTTGWTSVEYYRLRISLDSATLSYTGEGKVNITGDTMKVIRSMLENIEKASDREIKLYKENQELRRIILQLIKQNNEIHFTRGG